MVFRKVLLQLCRRRWHNYYAQGNLVCLLNELLRTED